MKQAALKLNQRLALGLLASALSMSMACGDSDTPGSDGGVADAASNPDATSNADATTGNADAAPGTDGGTGRVEQMVGPAGGTVQGDGFTITIPAGALAANTVITVEEVSKVGQPEEPAIAGKIFDLGPDGTTFAVPVQLVLEFDPSNPPDGATARMAFLSGTTWTRLSDSVVNGNRVTATTTHFTPFTIVWTAGTPLGNSCDSLGYAPCGGNIVGAWDVTLGCLTFTSTEPFNPNCPQARLEATVDFTGTADFNADGTFAAVVTRTATISNIFPKTCLPMGATCAQANAQEVGDDCVATTVQPPETETSSGTYVTSGSNIHFGSLADDPDSYCVQGDAAMIANDDDDVRFIYRLDRR